MLRIEAIFKTEERARIFQSKLDLLATEVPFSLHKLTVDSELIPVTDSSAFCLVPLLMRDYKHEDEEDSPEQTVTHSVTSTVPINDDLVMFQSIQSPESFLFISPEKAHIIDRADCVTQFPSLKDCPDNFLALSAELHDQFDGRSVPTGVPLFVIIPEEISSTTISSSLSSKVFTTVKICIYFYSEAAAGLASRFKHFETGPNHSVRMFLAAANPEMFVQCLNWKGVSGLLPLNYYSLLFLILFSAQRTLESWRQENPPFLPDLVIPYDESVLSALTPSPPLKVQPVSSREERHLLKQKKQWTPSPDPKLKKKGGRRTPPLPPAPSGR